MSEILNGKNTVNTAEAENNPGTQPCAADTAEAEKSSAAAAYGKFADAGALYSAYLALEAEFTRRSQRLKELEGENKAQSDDAPSRTGETSENSATLTEEVRRTVIENYLKSVAAGKGAPILAGGVGCAAPKSTPRSVSEAGRLVRQFLDK